jgi:hypothetical protein
MAPVCGIEGHFSRRGCSRCLTTTQVCVTFPVDHTPERTFAGDQVPFLGMVEVAGYLPVGHRALPKRLIGRGDCRRKVLPLFLLKIR